MSPFCLDSHEDEYCRGPFFIYDLQTLLLFVDPYSMPVGEVAPYSQGLEAALLILFVLRTLLEASTLVLTRYISAECREAPVTSTAPYSFCHFIKGYHRREKT